MVIGASTRGWLLSWVKKASGCIATLTGTEGIQSMASSLKDENNFFAATRDNRLYRWERQGPTHFTYSVREVELKESMDECLIECIEGMLHRLATKSFKIINRMKSRLPQAIFKTPFTADRPRGRSYWMRCRTSNITFYHSKFNHHQPSTRASSAGDRLPIVLKINQDRGRNFLRLLYIDKLDCLVAGCEDGVIYLFKYEEVLKKLSIDDKRNLEESNGRELSEGSSKSVTALSMAELCSMPILQRIVHKSEELQPNQVADEKLPVDVADVVRFSDQTDKMTRLEITMVEEDEVLQSIYRQLGCLRCQRVMLGHRDVVTCLVVFNRWIDSVEYTILLSSGWDARICIWNLETGELLDKYCEPGSQRRTHDDDSEKAADDAILDMAYSEALEEFAYASADCSVYVRQASVCGEKMHLVQKFTGHRADVGTVLYRPYDARMQSRLGEWVSGSNDCTIRIWPAREHSGSRMVLNTKGMVKLLAWDPDRQLLIAGVDNDIKTYELESGTMFQHLKGHVDVIQGIRLLSEKNQFLSAGADGRLCVWETWSGNRPSRSAPQVDTLPPAGDRETADLNDSTDLKDTVKRRAAEVVLKMADAAVAKRFINPAAAITAAAKAFSELQKVAWDGCQVGM